MRKHETISTTSRKKASLPKGPKRISSTKKPKSSKQAGVKTSADKQALNKPSSGKTKRFIGSDSKLEPSKSRKKASPNTKARSNSRCPVAHQCGACQFIDIPYEKQLENKQAFVRKLFDNLTNQTTILEPILGMDDPHYYRNKVVSPYAPGRKIRSQNTKTQQRKQRHQSLDCEVLCGMYAAGTHNIIATDDCLLENQVGKRIIIAIKDLLIKFGIKPYREDTGTGFMRHAVVRIGHSSNEVLVTLVTNESQFPGAKHFCRELVKRVPEITTIVQNVNTRQTNVILGETEKTLYGPGFILDTLCGLSFRISSHSFYQVNALQTEVLYRRAIELAQLTGKETVLDAYCGTGTIGLVAAKGLPDTPEAHAKRVIGVDSVAQAIADAKNNARHNGVENADFVAKDAGEFMTEIAKAGEELDVLLMDPPRAGSSEEFLRATVTLSPKRIVYISCNPKTQVRDVEYLLKHGYNLSRIQAVDMFPHTEHVETICTLSKN